MTQANIVIIPHTPRPCAPLGLGLERGRNAQHKLDVRRLHIAQQLCARLGLERGAGLCPGWRVLVVCVCVWGGEGHRYL